MAKTDLPLTVATVRPQHHPTPRPKALTRLSSAITNTFSKRFPQFSRLPIELRFEIWEACLPDGRVHELHPCGKLQHGKLMFRSNSAAPPIILHVCKESRYIALHCLKLMEYEPSFPTKPLRKFYFNPRADTLFLNTLTALYMTLNLLEESHEATSTLGIMKGWENIAFDADRAHLVTLLSGLQGRAPRPQFQRVFPNLKSLTIAFDFTRQGKTRFRTSVWPGENGTKLVDLKGDTTTLMSLFEPIREDLKKEFGVDEEGERVVDLKMANVKRKLFIRGNLRYGLRKACNKLGLTPRGVLRLL